MSIHELFEQHYSDHNDTTAENVKSCRLSNGSYNNLPIARAFRMFKAGFEANQGEKMQVLGFISKENARNVSDGWTKEIWFEPRHDSDLAVYLKDCDALNKGAE